MLVFGFGVSTDVNNLSFAVLDHDRTPESRAYLEELRGSSYFVEKPPLADYGDLGDRMKSGAIKAAIEIPPGFGRDIDARTTRLGRRLGGWRDAVPRGNHPRLSRSHACVVSGGPGGENDRRRPAAARRHRTPIQIQSGFRLHLCDGSREHVAVARAVSRHPDGARRRSGKGARVDHQPLCDPRHQARVSARQTTSLCRRRLGQFHLDVPDGRVRLSGSAQGKLSAAASRGFALRHRDDGLRHVDFRLHEHANRRAVRHRDPDRAAGDAIRGNDDCRCPRWAARLRSSVAAFP